MTRSDFPVGYHQIHPNISVNFPNEPLDELDECTEFFGT
jgi:hypothetical protein